MIRIKNPNSSGLPNEYQEVKYIQSTGTQYIDTGYTPVNGDEIEIQDVVCSRTSSNQAIFSAGTGTYQWVHLVSATDAWSSSAYYKYFATGTAPIVQPENTLEEPTTVKGTSSGLYYNGVQVATSSYGGTVNTGIRLLKRADGTSGANAKIGRTTIRSGETVVRDMIPCYRLSDNKSGMYDLATSTFHLNAGTGTFLIGTEVSRRDINIKPTIGGKTLLERYIGNMLVYKRGPSYIYTEFSSCPFPTDWDSIEGSNNNWGKTNNWGYWSIHSSSYSTSSPTYRVTCAFDNSYSTSTYWMPAKLTSATETATVEIDCPIPIKPNSISIMYRYAGGNSVIQGYNDDTGSWEDLSQLTSSTSRRTDTFSIATENFYSKFRIVFYRYSSTYGNPMLHEFQIKSGTIRQEG